MSEENKSKRHDKIFSLFPIILLDNREHDLSVTELESDLIEFFEIYEDNVKFKIESEDQYFKINYSKESFYQIIFSILYNIVSFMSILSDRKKTIFLKIEKEKIIFTYEHFLTHKDQLIKASSEVFVDQPWVFLLNFDSIFQSLDAHGIKYTINAKGVIDSLELDISTSHVQTKKVIKIEEYRNNKQ